jgi:hypothetical protein
MATEPPRATPVPSVVAVAQDFESFRGLRENPDRIASMLRGMMTALTGEVDQRRAWEKWVRPTDTVGIKVSAGGGGVFSTRKSLVNEVIRGCVAAGVPRTRIIVWDRDAAALRAAGFTEANLGVSVRGVDQPGGWDRKVRLTAPVIGRLIWGDALFSEKPKPGLALDASQLSGVSHLPRFFTQEITRGISLPVLRDDSGCGIAGAVYSITVGSVDNWRRFVNRREDGGSSLPDLLAEPAIAEKYRLHIVDALLPQYAGGPEIRPAYSVTHGALYASSDPVALDAVGLRLIDGWRIAQRMEPSGSRGEWLSTAAQMGLGAVAPEAIEVRVVGTK